MKFSVQTLEPADIHKLNAALGWLGLNSPADARAELDAITPAQSSHPAVLETRWLHRAYALRRVSGGGLPQAWDALLPAAKKFPTEPVIAYNLACYACQLQQADRARTWLQCAIQSGNKNAIKKMALADDDLKPLWQEIAEL